MGNVLCGCVPLRTLARFPLSVWLALLSLAVWASAAGAQSGTTMANRPKIGLVLEGGGALGLAHIGVIQWLEEHHIPVAYVAGTSMGGLVGGMYATGHSPQEMRDLIEGIDWPAVIGGRTPYQDYSYRRKEDLRDYPNSLEFGLRKGLNFPSGFNTGQQVGLIFDLIAVPYSTIPRFDDLPIPFACVGTDLVSGKPHVFRDGSLALALRSTMSLPGIFSPVRSGDQLFADGALLDNLPVDVARKMGAEVTLAVHLQVKELDPNQSLSSIGVLGRSVSVMIAANELRSMEQTDFLVTVPVADFSALDYEKADALIKRGYEAASAKAAMLSTLAVDDATWNAYVERRNGRRFTNLPSPQFVEVVGAPPQVAEKVRKQLSGMIGIPLDTSELDRQLMTLTGTGRFSNAGYRMIEKDGNEGLEIVMIEKSYAPPTVHPIFLIDGSDYNNPHFGAGARITFYDFGTFGSEWRNDVAFGSEYRLSSEYYFPLRSAGGWFVAPRLNLDSQLFDAYSRETFVAEYTRRHLGGGVDFGYEFGRVLELRVGYEAYDLKLEPLIGNPDELPAAQGLVGDTRMRIVLNNVDDPVIPRQGQYAEFSFDWYDTAPRAPNAFATVGGRASFFQRLDSPSSVYFSVQGGTSFGYMQTGLPQFSVGGSATGLPAYGSNELLTNQYALGTLGYIRQLVQLPSFLGKGIDLVANVEGGRVYQLPASAFPLAPPLSSRYPISGTGALVVNTIFGPLLVGGAVGDTGHHRFFFQLGRIF